MRRPICVHFLISPSFFFLFETSFPKALTCFGEREDSTAIYQVSPGRIQLRLSSSCGSTFSSHLPYNCTATHGPRKNLGRCDPALDGASNFTGLMAWLKGCPDTKPEFFQQPGSRRALDAGRSQ